MTRTASQGSEDLCVARVPLFAGLELDQQREVARFARAVTVAPGDTLVRAGQQRAPLFVVHTGMVKVSRRHPDGRETAIRVLTPGDVGGEVWFLTGERPQDDAVALAPTQACTFAHSDLADLLSRFPDIGVALLRTLGQRLGSVERRLAARTLADVGARLAAYLLDLPAAWTCSGRARLTLPMPKKDIAALLGTSPETLSRRLSALKRDGLIRARGQEIEVLDAVGLELRATGA